MTAFAVRARPSMQDNPWFQGGHNHSFPSGEASVAAGLVTSYILEYVGDYPATYFLALLPLYVGAGRIKNQAHWQTDVLAGWAVGGVSGGTRTAATRQSLSSCSRTASPSVFTPSSEQARDRPLDREWKRKIVRGPYCHRFALIFGSICAAFSACCGCVTAARL